MSRTLLKDWLLDKAKYTCTKQVFFLWTLAIPGQGGRVTMGLLGSLSKISNSLNWFSMANLTSGLFNHLGEFSQQTNSNLSFGPSLEVRFEIWYKIGSITWIPTRLEMWRPTLQHWICRLRLNSSPYNSFFWISLYIIKFSVKFYISLPFNLSSSLRQSMSWFHYWPNWILPLKITIILYSTDLVRSVLNLFFGWSVWS